MSSASDKARFYLEQSVPELKELERKKIFTPAEITSISKKRSDFEHKINARGSSPTDYARYAEFEINVDALRRKRVKRLGVKSTVHAGRRRTFFVLDRGTRKFPGDVNLWVQSIEFAKSEKAHKKLSQILAHVLRLHPMKSELWIWAARFAMDEHGDMTEARSYMQRGLRFCKNSRPLWLEYARLELSYIAKIAARRKVLGMGNERNSEEQPTSDDFGDNIIHLPTITTEDINPQADKHDHVDYGALQRLETTPALEGEIPMAVFDAAMLQFNDDPNLALKFFQLVADFENLPCRHRILEHILRIMAEKCAGSWQTQACEIRNPIVDIAGSSPDFPAALGTSLSRLKSALESNVKCKPLAAETNRWIAGLLANEDLDDAIRKVLRSQTTRLNKIESVET